LRVTEKIVLDAEHGVDINVWRAVHVSTPPRAKIGEHGRFDQFATPSANGRDLAFETFEAIVWRWA